jgi:hypothetical protein
VRPRPRPQKQPDHFLEHLHGKAAVRGEKVTDAFRLAAAGAIFVLAAM